jgi:hypothetical protein
LLRTLTLKKLQTGRKVSETFLLYSHKIKKQRCIKKINNHDSFNYAFWCTRLLSQLHKPQLQGDVVRSHHTAISFFPSNIKSLPVEKGEKNKVWWPQLLSIEHLGPSQTHASMN